MFFDPYYLLFLSPALILMLWAQMRVKSTYASAQRVDARLSGAAAARYLLDYAGCQDVAIEETHGFLSDHYDPRHRVLRLSHNVYHNHSAASVGIAAHEAGHALQHAQGYMPLAVRNAAVPAASVGPTIGIILMVVGCLMSSTPIIWLGILLFAAIVFFQVVNLPEPDATLPALLVVALLARLRSRRSGSADL